MDRQEKEKFVADFHDRLLKAQGAFLVDYKGLNVDAMNWLRGELRKTDAEFQVVKNRLLKLACEDTDTVAITQQMEGPSAVALAHGDVVAPAKTLVGFAKDNKSLKIKGGQISGKLMDFEAIKRLAELPSREVLLAKALCGMQEVPASLVRVLNGIVARLLYALKAIEQEKGEPA